MYAVVRTYSGAGAKELFNLLEQCKADVEAVMRAKAILRTTPVLLGLFSIITLWANDLAKSRKLKPRTAAWYPKTVLTFSDAIAAVRREIWHHQISFVSRPRRDSIEIPRHIWQRMENALAHAA